MMSGGNVTETTEDWSDFDFSSVKLEKERVVTITTRKEIIQTIIIGLVGGALVWMFKLVFENWVMRPLFCRTPDTAAICANNHLSSFIIAIVIVGAISTAIAIAMRTYRALVISLATFVSFGALWGILNAQTTVWTPFIISAIFLALLYLFFTSLGSIKKTSTAIILILLSMVLFWVINIF